MTGSHHHTGCSVTTRSVVGAAGLVGCSAVIVLAFHVRSGAASCLEDLNQLKTPSPNILKCDGVVDMWKCFLFWREKKKGSFQRDRLDIELNGAETGVEPTVMIEEGGKKHTKG